MIQLKLRQVLNSLQKSDIESNLYSELTNKKITNSMLKKYAFYFAHLGLSEPTKLLLELLQIVDQSGNNEKIKSILDRKKINENQQNNMGKY